MYIPIPNLDGCKPLTFRTLICSNLFAYPIDDNAICEAQLLKRLRVLPTICQTSVIFSKGYNIQELQENTWLIIVAEPLQITINCPHWNPKTEIILKNSILKLQPECSSFVGVTKVQANYKQISESYYDSHPVLIPFNCCNSIPENLNLPNLKPLKLNNLNIDDLNIAQHKLDEYSKTLDDMINEPFVTKHISWFTYFTITIIVVIIIWYIFCKCRRKRRLAIAISQSPPPPSPPRKTFSFRSILPRRRPSIRPEEVREELELN